jgi:hypothetical protein
MNNIQNIHEGAIQFSFIVIDEETVKNRRLLKKLVNFKNEIIQKKLADGEIEKTDYVAQEIFNPNIPRFANEDYFKPDFEITLENYEEMFEDLKENYIPFYEYVGFRTKCINFFLDGSYEMGESYFTVLCGKCEETKLNDFKRHYTTEDNNYCQYDVPCELTFSNQAKYVGDSKFKIMHGQGVMDFANGEKYTGEWFGGMKHGLGTYDWPNGDSYTGEFQLNMMWGQGKLTLGDGETLEGEFKKGNLVEAK